MKLVLALGAALIVVLIWVQSPDQAPSAPPEAPIAQTPASQSAFTSRMLARTIVARTSPNSLGFTVARRERAEEVAAWPYARDWIGYVGVVQPTAQGNAAFTVRLPGAAMRMFLTTSPYDEPNGGTLIRRQTPMFEMLSRLRIGQVVRFDGQFVCAVESETGAGARSDCPRGLLTDAREAMDGALLYFRFDAVRPVE